MLNYVALLLLACLDVNYASTQRTKFATPSGEPVPLASDSSLQLPWEDIVHVTFTDAGNKARLALLRAHRTWRPAQMRAVVGVNVQGKQLKELNTEGRAHNESYLYYPDKWRKEHMYLPGDVR